MYLKHSKTVETMLTTESNYLPAKLALLKLAWFFNAPNNHIYSVENYNKYFLKP